MRPPGAYRDTVEALFRVGMVRVCIATGTLALGINMPCRSVIFIGDSPHMNPLQFRQMAGRAGRRGYDYSGDVIFLGYRLERIAYLACTQLTGAYGNFLVTTSAVARVAGVLANCGVTHRAAVASSATSLLCEPLAVTAGREHMQVRASAWCDDAMALYVAAATCTVLCIVYMIQMCCSPSLSHRPNSEFCA